MSRILSVRASPHIVSAGVSSTISGGGDMIPELAPVNVPFDIRMPPTNHSWAVEIQIEDPDRNVIRFGSEPK